MFHRRTGIFFPDLGPGLSLEVAVLFPCLHVTYCCILLDEFLCFLLAAGVGFSVPGDGCAAGLCVSSSVHGFDSIPYLGGVCAHVELRCKVSPRVCLGTVDDAVGVCTLFDPSLSMFVPEVGSLLCFLSLSDSFVYFCRPPRYSVFRL